MGITCANRMYGRGSPNLPTCLPCLGNCELLLCLLARRDGGGQGAAIGWDVGVSCFFYGTLFVSFGKETTVRSPPPFGGR